MLYIDGISISKIKEELKKDLLSKRVNRIFKNNEYSVSLHFGKIELLFSCIPTLPICYITKNKEQPILDIASSFISNLRKYLMNSSLVNIEQLGLDRILVFHFSKINELGEIKKYKIYLECLGKLANIIFTDADNKIIDSLKKFHLSETSDRTLFLGEEYKRPKFENKISPFEIQKEEFDEKQKNNKLMDIEGLGKILVSKLENYEIFENILKDEIKPTIYFENSIIKLATVLDLAPVSFDEVKKFETYFDMINFFIDYEYKATSFMLLKNKLKTTLDKKIKKLEKIISMIKKDIDESQNMENIKNQGDILASVLYNVKKGMSNIKAYDFYNNKEIDIELNPLISPKENLDRIYKKYNKTKRGLVNALRREEEIMNEIKYLESTLLFIETASDVVALREIEEELISYKYLKSENIKKKNKLKKSINYGIIEKDNYIILYGRNNIENDNLTFKVSSKSDYWFHVKDIPSSHVIVKTDRLTDEIIREAAQIAAHFSKGLVGDRLSVDYTLRKNVSKPNGAKAGFVIYNNQKTVIIDKIKIDIV
ncbi:NFACT family protein [Fusobacterium massiliense]|uniref:Rqc2 family fibronectin-binding protein n=1 Tax=Fusobacterium massiliense TaxID=1852365 RepID=UPI0028D677B1|nr:NFACT family protein [Fusobacterium massiliense]